MPLQVIAQKPAGINYFEGISALVRADLKNKKRI
jgi:hypothetical protein